MLSAMSFPDDVLTVVRMRGLLRPPVTLRLARSTEPWVTVSHRKCMQYDELEDTWQTIRI